MSLIKAKFNKCKARRIKLSNRNKINFLNNKVKKIKIEKNILAKKLQDNIEIIEDELKSEKKKVDNLKKQIECPICLEVPRKGPVYACPNGHLVCQRCKQESCPTCMEDVGDNKSLVAVAVIENILHDCKFVECAEEFSLSHIEAHEKICEHRFVACPYQGKCDQRVALSKLLDHLEKTPCSSNTEPILVTGSCGFENFNLSILGRLKNPQISWKVTTYCYDGHFFALKVNKAGDFWRFVIVMFESPAVCSEFSIGTEVYEASSSPDRRISAKVRCQPCSIDHTAAEMEGFGLYVPHRFMEKMVLKEESFRFTVSFSFF